MSAQAGWVATGCGGLLTLITAAVGLFGAFHVFLDPRGKISRDEAMPALLGGGCCSFMSLAIAVIGIVLVVRARSAAPSDDQAPPG